MGARSIEYTCEQIDSHNNDKLNSYNSTQKIILGNLWEQQNNKPSRRKHKRIP